LTAIALALREELWRTGVGVSAISPTFVSEAGMWAETGLKANPMAAEVRPEQVADAVYTAITKNKAEVDVVRLPLRASLKVMAVAPGLFMSVARSGGASRASDAAGDRQKNKR
jgi:short-subunit dehydrogenase